MTNPDGTNAPIFVVGCARSGTTLVRDLLNNHPQLALLPYETHLLPRYRDHLSGIDLKDPDRFEEFWKRFVTDTYYDGAGIDAAYMRDRWLAAPGSSTRDFFTCLMKTYAESQGKPFYGEKTPDHFRFVEQLFDWYPDARILFVVRDPRAVLTSWLTLRNPWTRVPQRDVLDRWRESIKVAGRWVDDPRTLVVKYERLVAQPRAELAAITGFLGVTEGIRPPGVTVRADRAERWKTTLFPTEVRMVESQLGPEMQAWGYATNRATSALHVVRAALTRSTGFLRWSARRILRAI